MSFGETFEGGSLRERQQAADNVYDKEQKQLKQTLQY
jgi:hypothetical protein